MKSEEAAIREVIERWARATREGRHDDVLANHLDDLVIFDVLPPMRYESAAKYRESWDEWQPDAQGECGLSWKICLSAREMMLGLPSACSNAEGRYQMARCFATLYELRSA